MAHGASGRIVIDLDPKFKEELYDTLKSKGVSMKQWFLAQAESLCDEHRQPTLSLVAETPPTQRGFKSTQTQTR